VLPRDKQTEQTQDLLEWNSGLMTTKDYLKKWRPELGDDAAIDTYIVELGAAKAAKEPSLPTMPGDMGNQMQKDYTL
jgi:hypothetical protein